MLQPDVRRMAQEPNFAAVATLMPDGSIQNQPIWVTCDDEHILLNTEVHRQKYKNVLRDPRITVCIWDRANPYAYVEVRGRVTETRTGPEARQMIDALSLKYNGRPYPPEAIRSERVILVITPDVQRAEV
jgi:PPOX class probable F420-dependent enzyme